MSKTPVRCAIYTRKGRVRKVLQKRQSSRGVMVCG